MDVPDTPLSIRILRYMPNANVGRAQAPIANNLADKGAGATMNVVATPSKSLTPRGELNTATAYVEVSGPDGVIGTWLVSNVIDERFPPQMVELGDKSWEIALRFTTLLPPLPSRAHRLQAREIPRHRYSVQLLQRSDGSPQRFHQGPKSAHLHEPSAPLRRAYLLSSFIRQPRQDLDLSKSSVTRAGFSLTSASF